MNGLSPTKPNGIHAKPPTAPHKSKSRPAFASGVYQSDSVKDIADSLGITTLQEAIAGALASDVEYRINQVIEESVRFMKHAKRTALTTSDVDLALRSLNIEPLYGHSPAVPVAFRRFQPAHNEAKAFVYIVEDEEVDLERVVRERRVKVPREIGVKPHWLAVEGVQPLIPENPPPPPSHPERATSPSSNADPLPSTLPLPLQLYHTRLLSALLSPDDARRAAALASLAADAGLQLLVPNLVNWVGERVARELAKGEEGDKGVLDVALGMIGSMAKNENIFLEPYLHQILPPLLSLLLVSPHPSPPLRLKTSSTLSLLISLYSPKYTTLASRLLKTFLRALLEPERALGTRAGAVRGLAALGVEGVRRGLVESRGAEALGRECEAAASSGAGEEGDVAEEVQELVQAVLDALQRLVPAPGEAGEQGKQEQGPETGMELDAPGPTPLSDAELGRLEEVLGGYFARLVGVQPWGRGVLGAVGKEHKEHKEGGEGKVEAGEKEEGDAVML
ncbi:TAF-domain-containing protein [Calocera viscosa TUFC12733]|uniref:TBP-associated factor 6 n=1 Tax=Calocera viscosa (strain TUFC12733) TaxID=1330018 RepID=A0A167IHF1_CALVF|nr:TAF-domain-containing protein [Calocera viscosa TUFC12733]